MNFLTNSLNCFPTSNLYSFTHSSLYFYMLFNLLSYPLHFALTSSSLCFHIIFTLLPHPSLLPPIISPAGLQASVVDGPYLHVMGDDYRS